MVVDQAVTAHREGPSWRVFSRAGQWGLAQLSAWLVGRYKQKWSGNELATTTTVWWLNLLEKSGLPEQMENIAAAGTVRRR